MRLKPRVRKKARPSDQLAPITCVDGALDVQYDELFTPHYLIFHGVLPILHAERRTKKWR